MPYYLVSVPFDALIEEKSHLCGIAKGEGVQKLALGVCGLFWFFPFFRVLWFYSTKKAMESHLN